MNRRANPVPEELHLPLEILATILHELASDTKDNDKTLAALAACRLASHTLCSLATPLFFSSIELTDNGLFRRALLLSNRAKKLNQILSSDAIADSVKTFMLCGQRESFASQPNGILISKILRRLSHIQTFALSGLSSSIGRLSDWAKDITSAIQALCKSPNLTTLYLHNIDGFPITVIAACPNLRHLRLWSAIPDVNPFFVLYIHNHQRYIPVRRCRFNRRDIKTTAPPPGFIGD